MSTGFQLGQGSPHKMASLKKGLNYTGRNYIFKSIKTKQISPDLHSIPFTIQNFALWQYGLWSFQIGDTKLKRSLPKNQYTQRKLLNFEFWISGELSKIGHHFSNKVI